MRFKGGRHLKPPKFEHICSFHNFSPLCSVQILLIPGGIKEIRVNFFDPASSQHHNSGGGKKKTRRYITAKSFSNPHTEFGARRSRRLGVRIRTNRRRYF